MQDHTPLPAQLRIVAWPDPVIDALGFVPHDPYSELVWTPSLGPSAVLAWRRMAGTLIHRPDGFTLEVAELAHALGLGHGTAHNAPVCRTLRRLSAFALARFGEDDTYAVRRHIPPINARQVCRLSSELRRIHTVLLTRHDDE
ncbi:MAG: hypothetical protein M3063_04645, partial [Actinomycetota bacterium]|nr:hypothetical protein [Actinomycetota bacterium]